MAMILCALLVRIMFMCTRRAHQIIDAYKKSTLIIAIAYIIVPIILTVQIVNHKHPEINAYEVLGWPLHSAKDQALTYEQNNNTCLKVMECPELMNGYLAEVVRVIHEFEKADLH